MHTSRGGHYFTWFVVFGLIAGIVSFLSGAGVSPEALWLLGAGLLGMVFAHNRLSDFGRFYDFLVGVIFALAGLVGLAHTVSPGVLPSAIASGLIVGTKQDATLLGLSLAVVPSALHLILGVISFMHGVNNAAKTK